MLSLSSCSITTPSAACAVGAMLTSIRCGLQYISLECNTLGGPGIEALCTPGFLTLQVLNLASTGVNANDSLMAVAALGRAIRSSKLLQAVDFNLNVITLDAAASLSDSLVKARRDGSKIDEFVVTTILDHRSYQSLALDPSMMNSWTSRMRENKNSPFRRTPTPSPFLK